MVKPAVADDKLLSSMVANGSEEAFRTLFKRYYDHIYGVAFAFTKSPAMSEDLVQDVFLKIWFKRELLRSVARFDAYLFMVARNHILNELEKRIHEEQFTDDLHNYFREVNNTPENYLILKETEEIIIEAVNRLPLQQQAVFRLSREEELSQELIAERMNISVNTVKSHMNKSLRFIRHHLRKYYNLFF
jgi:RNA polymerase sigma-70 factor (ECF subfamily)